MYTLCKVFETFIYPQISQQDQPVNVGFRVTSVED